MTVPFYPAAWTRLLRRHGVQIWEVTGWYFQQDIHTCYFEADRGLPTFIPFNQRVTVKLLSGEEKIIYLGDEVKAK